MPRQNKKAQKAKDQCSDGSGFHSVEHRVLSNSSDLEDPTWADHSSGEELDIQEDIMALQNVYSVPPPGPPPFPSNGNFPWNIKGILLA